MKYIFLNRINLQIKFLIFFFQNPNIRTRPEIIEPKLKIPESEPKYRIIRTCSISLYQNIIKFEIPDPNLNGYPNANHTVVYYFSFMMVRPEMTYIKLEATKIFFGFIACPSVTYSS